jgi:hypothetical protein
MGKGKFMRGSQGLSLGVGLGLACGGCTVSSDEGSSFGGSVTVSTSVSTTVGSGGESDTGEGSSSSEGGESSSEGGAESTSGVDGSGSGEASSGGVLEESSGGGGTGGGQPADGMYSHCLAAAECVGVNLCITITPQGAMEPSTGFCSSTGCAMPATDCDPSPGGTATPVCVPVTVNMMPQQACALDCAGGKTCPAPMTCTSVNGLGMICA